MPEGELVKCRWGDILLAHKFSSARVHLKRALLDWEGHSYLAPEAA